MPFAWFLYYIFLLLCNWHAQMLNLKTEDRKKKREKTHEEESNRGRKMWSAKQQMMNYWGIWGNRRERGRLANLKLCWNLWRHINRNTYTPPSIHMSKKSPSLYCFRGLLCFHAHDTTFHEHTVLGLNLSSPYKIPHKHTVLRIWSAARSQDTGNKTSSYQFTCSIVIGNTGL